MPSCPQTNGIRAGREDGRVSIARWMKAVLVVLS
jgi:hypothetical protein